MEIAAVALLGALAYKLTDFLRFVSGRDLKAAMTQAIAWASGVGAVFMFAASDFGSQVEVNGMTLDEFNAVSLIILGMSASSVFGFANDALSAVDQTRTSQKPGMFGD